MKNEYLISQQPQKQPQKQQHYQHKVIKIQMNRHNHHHHNNQEDELDKECSKASRTLKSFTVLDENHSHLNPDKLIPRNVIDNAKGLVIMTVVKAGILISGRFGFGIVVAKLPNGNWSAPSAVGTASLGAGFQVGAEVTDLIIILNTERAVEAFSLGGNVALGGNISVAAGPFGRDAEASGMATLAATYSYSKTKGIFAGISLEGTVFIERKDANEKFYGLKCTAKDLLTGKVPPPREAHALYEALKFRTASHRLSLNANEADKIKLKAKVEFDFDPQQPGDLPLKVGEIVEIIERSDHQKDWWKGRIGDREGTFPANYVKML